MAVKKIVAPRWDNEDKTRIRCEFVYEDGGRVSAAVSQTENGNPDWDAIKKQYKDTEIGEFVPAPIVAPAEPDPEAQQKRLNEILFAAKLDIFKMQEVKDSTNRTLKAKIRKADNLAEVYVYSAVLVNQETATPKKTKKKTKAK